MLSNYNKEAVRKFHLDKADSQSAAIFASARQMLKKCQWDTIQISADANNAKGHHGYSVEFDEIEIDALLHVHSPTVDTIDLGKSFFLLKPVASISADRFLERQISDKSIDPQANVYVVAEITLDGSPRMVEKKVCQLERDLALLLARQRIQLRDDTVTIGNIIRFASLMSPSAQLKAVTDFLSSHKDKLPLIYSLYQQKRLYIAKIKPDNSYVEGKIKEWNSDSDVVTSFSNHSLQKVVKIGHDGVFVDVNIAGCVTFDDFREKVQSSSGTLRQTGEISSVFRFDGQIPVLVDSVDAFKADTTYFVTTGEVLTGVKSLATMDEFYKALERDQRLNENQIKKIRDVLEEQDIVSTVLPRLTDEKLKEYGLKQGGLREAILTVLGK
jgi:hypothetical protein